MINCCLNHIFLQKHKIANLNLNIDMIKEIINPIISASNIAPHIAIDC